MIRPLIVSLVFAAALLGIVAGVGSTGCSSSARSLSGAAGSAGGDLGGGGAAGAGGTRDGGLDATGAAGAADATDAADTSADAGAAACPRSIADYCAGSQYPGQCDPTWSDVVAETHFCGTLGVGSQGIFNEVYSCGPYDVRAWVNVDVGYTSYYDGTTGALVATWSWYANGGGGSSCGAPAGFERPVCPRGTPTDYTCVDAGTD